MKNKILDAVELKRILQKNAERKFALLSEPEQLELLRRKFGHLIRPARQAKRPVSKTAVVK